MASSTVSSTATLRCIEGYVLITAGLAFCGSDREWIIENPDCRGILL